MQNTGDLFIGKAFKIRKPQHLPVFLLQLLHTAVEQDLVFLEYVPLLQVFFLIADLQAVIQRQFRFLTPPQMIDGRIPADGVQPCFESRLLRKTGALDYQLYKGLFRQLFRKMQIIDNTMQI